MSKPLLSILIPTVVGREQELDRFFKNRGGKEKISDNFIYGQLRLLFDTFEIVIFKDNKEITIGEKRERLYQSSEGLYSWQIDDDDDIAEGAIEKVLEAIKNNPDVDCITFKEKCMIDGVYHASNFSMKYPKWENNVDGYSWVRNVFYKCVIKTSIAQSVPFEHIRFGEDEKWAMALAPHLKSEVHIDEEIYYYLHNSTPHHERYGFDKDV